MRIDGMRRGEEIDGMRRERERRKRGRKRRRKRILGRGNRGR